MKNLIKLIYWAIFDLPRSRMLRKRIVVLEEMVEVDPNIVNILKEWAGEIERKRHEQEKIHR